MLCHTAISAALLSLLLGNAGARTSLLPPGTQILAKCGNGKSIPTASFCDGREDCEDGYDESDCRVACGGEKSKRIPFRWLCDGDEDCPGGDDEKCFQCQNKKKIFAGFQCDGDDDCGDESDEDCFSCKSGKAIPKGWLCDGEDDCGDNSDETSCFVCRNKRRLLVKWRCDGEDDCGDGSDERNCRTPSTTRPPPTFPPRRVTTTKRPSTKNNGVGISSKMAKFIVDWHNEQRGKVARGEIPRQPKAKNMKVMRWDDEIAAKSQEWADNCNYMHEPNRHCRTGGYHSLGENIGVSTVHIRGRAPVDKVEIKRVVTTAFRMMFNEHRYWTYNKIPGRCTKEPCGHYTQMVWAESETIGCGLAECRNIRNWAPGRGRRVLYLVCKYGPTGNIEGVVPYNEGKVCTGCGKEMKSCSGGLCSGRVRGGEECSDSTRSCAAMKALKIKGRYSCWPCEKWSEDGTCDPCAPTFRHARDVCAKSCRMCAFDYTLNNGL